MTTKRVAKPRASRKTQRATIKSRAAAIVADAKGYDADTRNAIKNALDGDGSDLGELVRRAEAGEIIWDVSKPNGDGEAPDKAALDYARKAYDAALDHYHANHADPFSLSRLAVVYDEQEPGDTNMVVTLPGHLRDRAVTDEEVRGWIHDAELFARTLAHPKCDEAFRNAFGAIYTEEMLQGSGVDWMTPEVLRVMFPLVMLAGSGTNHVCDDSKARDILILLQSEMVNEETQAEVRKPLGLQ
jgi:hypothetical protein